MRDIDAACRQAAQQCRTQILVRALEEIAQQAGTVPGAHEIRALAREALAQFDAPIINERV